MYNVIANERINKIIISDISGKLIKNISSDMKSHTVNTSDLSAGVYIFTIKTVNQIITKKVIVNK